MEPQTELQLHVKLGKRWSSQLKGAKWAKIQQEQMHRKQAIYQNKFLAVKNLDGSIDYYRSNDNLGVYGVVDRGISVQPLPNLVTKHVALSK